LRQWQQIRPRQPCQKFQSLKGIIGDCGRLGLKPLLYLVFQVQFRGSGLKVPFQPLTCQGVEERVPLNGFPRKGLSVCEVELFSRRECNAYPVGVSGEKFALHFFTPPLPRKIKQKISSYPSVAPRQSVPPFPDNRHKENRSGCYPHQV
jgi:hypothetical protein